MILITFPVFLEDLREDPGMRQIQWGNRQTQSSAAGWIKLFFEGKTLK